MQPTRYEKSPETSESTLHPKAQSLYSLRHDKCIDTAPTHTGHATAVLDDSVVVMASEPELRIRVDGGPCVNNHGAVGGPIRHPVCSQSHRSYAARQPACALSRLVRRDACLLASVSLVATLSAQPARRQFERPCRWRKSTRHCAVAWILLQSRVLDALDKAFAVGATGIYSGGFGASIWIH